MRSEAKLRQDALATVTAHARRRGWPGVRVCDDCTDTGCKRCRKAVRYLDRVGWSVRGAGGNR